MDSCVVESNCIIAAGAVVLEGTHCERKWINLCRVVQPKKVKEIDAERLEGTVKRIASSYPMYASWIDKELD